MDCIQNLGSPEEVVSNLQEQSESDGKVQTDKYEAIIRIEA